MVSQGRRLDWEDVAELEEGETVEVIVTMKGGTRNRKKKNNRNPCKSDSEARLRRQGSRNQRGARWRKRAGQLGRRAIDK